MALSQIADFIVSARPPDEARARAATAFADTIGVTLAGAAEPAARIVRETIAEPGGSCRIFGTEARASAGAAALANGTAAHALDFDDMCFVSLAHPSAPLVPAILAAAEIGGASGRDVLDAYVIGFEIEARFGRTMNPRHYEKGWHCTSTLGTIGAAAAVSRLVGADESAAAHAVGIAASMASGLKENFGSMVKPLHAGTAARNGLLAALLARRGLTASGSVLEGRQGLLAAMDSQRPSLEPETADLGERWEIVGTGITVKLYPSCAGTHPALDAVLDLRREHALEAAGVEAVRVEVDRITPTILLYERPTTGLEGKFSMSFCVAAALAHGRVDIGTFEPAGLEDPATTRFLPRVTMRVDPAFDTGAPALTRARVHITLRNGRTITRDANGARGYPERPVSEDELRQKFMSCAQRSMSETVAESTWQKLRRIEDLPDVRETLTTL